MTFIQFILIHNILFQYVLIVLLEFQPVHIISKIFNEQLDNQLPFPLKSKFI